LSTYRLLLVDLLTPPEDEELLLCIASSMVPDLRRVVGSRVHAKAHHVTAHAECARRYGAAKTTKLIGGTVLEADEAQKPGNSRSSWFITAEYDLGGGTVKRARLNTRSVKLGNPHSLAPPPLTTPPIAPAASPIAPPALPDPLAPPVPQPAPVPPPVPDVPQPSTTPVLPRVPPLPPPGRPHQPTTTAHDTEWFEDPIASYMPIGGNVPQREWSICTVIGESLRSGSDSRKALSRLEYFLLMFPPNQLATIMTLTSEHLIGLHKDPTTPGGIKDPTTPGEILKLFGVLILITRYDFSS
jgi:hypothetical protein